MVGGLQGVLISPKPDQEGNKLMFLSEWREFPSAPCLAGKQTWWHSNTLLSNWCTNIQFVDRIKIIQYLKVLRHVSDQIRELCTVLGWNCKNDSIVSVDMDVVGVMVAYSDAVSLWIVHWIGRHMKNMMTARVSMLLKSRASLACFRACFLPHRAKDLSAPR